MFFYLYFTISIHYRDIKIIAADVNSCGNIFSASDQNDWSDDSRFSQFLIQTFMIITL